MVQLCAFVEFSWRHCTTENAAANSNAVQSNRIFFTKNGKADFARRVRTGFGQMEVCNTSAENLTSETGSVHLRMDFEVVARH